MKDYHEIGTVKEDGLVSGFFIKEGGMLDNAYAFFVPYEEFVDLVKSNRVQQLYWDESVNNICVNIDDEYGEEALSKRTKKKINTAIQDANICDFETFMQKDMIFQCSDKDGLIPAAILYVVKMLFTESVSLCFPYTQHVEELYHALCSAQKNIKWLTQIQASCMNITIPVIQLQETLSTIESLGYDVVYCMDSAKNIIHSTEFDKLFGTFIRPVPESSLSPIESILQGFNYRSYTNAHSKKPESVAHMTNAFR